MSNVYTQCTGNLVIKNCKVIPTSDTVAELNRLTTKVQELVKLLSTCEEDKYELKAKVQELEAENAHLKADVESLSSLVKKIMKNRNRVKADAIEEMCEKKYAWFTAQQIIWMERYAKKLREGEDD